MSSPADTAFTALRACVAREDIEAVVAVLKSGAVGAGREVERFETALGRALGAPHATVVASTTAAFQLAFQALGVGPGRVVWMAASAPFAAAAAVQGCGGELVFLDVERAGGNLDVRACEERLAAGEVPHVLLASHAAGLPCDLEWLLGLKRRHDFTLLEDASEALGARLRVAGRRLRAGEHPEVEASVFSFDVGAPVTTGRGAAVTTHDAARAERLRRLRGPGADGAATRELGHDCALSDLLAALGASQLEKLSELVGARREQALRYLAELRGFALPQSFAQADKEHAWHAFWIECAPEERAALQAHLAERHVRTELPRAPLTSEAWFQGRGSARPCPNAEARVRGALGLPLGPSLSHADQGRVIAALAEWRALREAA